MKSDLTKRRQRTRVNSNFSAWERIISGVPQGSTLDPLLFNILLNDLLLVVENSDLSNYADDNTLYSCGNNLEKVKQTQRGDFQIVTKWFYENYMVLNSGKCHFMCLGKHARHISLIIVKRKIVATRKFYEELLTIVLSFKVM